MSEQPPATQPKLALGERAKSDTPLRTKAGPWASVGGRPAHDDAANTPVSANAAPAEALTTNSDTDQAQPLIEHTGRAFWVALVIGLICAGLGTQAQNAGDPLAWIGVAGPILTIIAFFIFGRSRGWQHFPDKRQRFADACYFLGFILTMAALIFGFLPAGLSENRVLDAREVLRHFGMALGATAAGLIGRILILQSRNMGRETIEADLERAAQQVTAEARAIAVELQNARQQLADDRAVATQQQRDAATAMMLAIATEIKAALAPITVELSERVAETNSSLAAATNLLTAQIKQHSEAMAAAGAAMESAYLSAASGGRDLARLSARGGEGLGALLTQLAIAIAGGRDASAAMTATTRDAEAATRNGATSLEALRDTLAALQQDLAGRIAETAAMPGQVQGLGDDMRAALRDFEARVTQALTNSSARVDVDLVNATNSLERVINTFSTSVKALQAEP